MNPYAERQAALARTESEGKREGLLGFGAVPRPSSTRLELLPDPTAMTTSAGLSTTQNVCMPMQDFIKYEKMLYWRGIRNMALTGFAGMVLGVAGYLYLGKKIY